MTKPTQDLGFWNKRIEEGGCVENGMAVGFRWDIIDPIHRAYTDLYINPTDKVLDAGCAYGRTSRWFPQKGYVGVDFVKSFISEARRRNPGRKYIVCNLENLPFENGQFDWAVLISVKVVIRSDPNGEEKWANIYKELKRVAKRILILEYGNSVPEYIHEAVEVL